MADGSSRINAGLGGAFPEGMKFMKFFIKDATGEYYNMAMDRFYDAEDGNVWLAFPSSDRNKIDIDSFLVLKKGQESDDLVKEAARYKVIAIENEAPDFIKTKKTKVVEIGHYVSTSNINTNDLYGTGLSDAPIRGAKDFVVNYQPFKGSSGARLHEIYTGAENAILYIEWGLDGTQAVSDRYRIAEMTCDWDNDSSTIGSSKYHIRLDKALGDDVNFITDDDTGNNPSRIEEGAITNIYKYTIENSPKFDGRFFVKILKDDVFQASIKPLFSGVLEYIPVDSRKIYSMTKNFIHDDYGSRRFQPSKTGIGLKNRGTSTQNIYSPVNMHESTSPWMSLWGR